VWRWTGGDRKTGEGEGPTKPYGIDLCQGRRHIGAGAVMECSGKWVNFEVRARAFPSRRTR